MHQTNTTIGIADDHALFLSSVKAVIEQEPGFTVTIEASNGKAYIENAWKLGAPEISILDVNMPSLNGIETFRCMRNMFRKSKVIMMTGYSDWVTLQELQTSGAHGIISKNAEPGEFVSVIRSVRDLQLGDGAEKPQEKLPKPKDGADLNVKELQFAKLLCTGISYGDIADQMHLSKHTVYDYRDRLFEFFGVKSQASLIVKLIGHHVITNIATDIVFAPPF